MITEFNEKGHPMVFSDEAVNTEQLKEKCIKAIESLSGVHGAAERKAEACFKIALSELENNWKQRAEAAEAKVKELEQEQAEHDGQIANLQGKFDLALAGLRSKTSRCDKAEAKLAELQNQKPIGRVDRGHVSDSNEYPDARVVCLHEHVGWEAFQDGTELFTRPEPDINLAELVPGECDLVAEKQNGFYERAIGWNECRAAMLRNIEEAK